MGLSILEQTISNNLPLVGVSLIFGYGSKVIRQGGIQSADDQLDIVIAADDPYNWHKENYRLNNQHYSFLRYLPDNIRKITDVQEKYGAKVYYNPFVQMGNLSIKYGIVKTDHLMEDLLSWDMLYLAGRMHKPVEFISKVHSENEPLKLAMRFNKESALRAALLQLPETFDLMQLYTTITGLSYKGDLRMSFGEDKNKITNIVSTQRERFDQLYLPIIKLNQNFKDSVQWSESKQLFSQDISPKSVLRNLKLLPLNVKRIICEIHGPKARTIESDAVLASVSKSVRSDEILAQALAAIVRRSSLTQSLKGVFTAGFVKSIRYSQRKLKKSLFSRLVI